MILAHGARTRGEGHPSAIQFAHADDNLQDVAPFVVVDDRPNEENCKGTSNEHSHQLQGKHSRIIYVPAEIRLGILIPWEDRPTEGKGSVSKFWRQTKYSYCRFCVSSVSGRNVLTYKAEQCRNQTSLRYRSR